MMYAIVTINGVLQALAMPDNMIPIDLFKVGIYHGRCKALDEEDALDSWELYQSLKHLPGPYQQCKETIHNQQMIDLITNSLYNNNGNVTLASKEINISRNTLYILARKYDININSYRK